MYNHKYLVTLRQFFNIRADVEISLGDVRAQVVSKAIGSSLPLRLLGYHRLSPTCFDLESFAD